MTKERFTKTARKTGSFFLSLLCGIVVPLSTLPAEAWVKGGVGQIDSVSWFSAGVTYVAGIGLVSGYKGGLVAMLIAAGMLAFVYGVDMKGAVDWSALHPDERSMPLDPFFAQIMIGLASVMYVGERIGKHLVEDRPFLGGLA